jgi:hypothetical protein
MQKSKEEVLALLVALGTTSQEVANKLQYLGIRGKRKQCLTCPIAQYLVSNEFGFGVEVGLAGEVVSVAGIGRVALGHWYSILKYHQLQGIRDFILDFDRGKYPQLEVSQ